jgi:methoxymalonate biosynthesis acyl carrier protein
MNASEIAGGIEAFIRATFDVSSTDTNFDHEVDLFELGYVDSVGFAELIEFLQDRFSVTIPDSALLSDEFLSIRGMAGIISRLADQ